MNKERGVNAQYQIVDVVEMVVIGLLAGTISMVQIVKVWADEVLKKMTDWEEVPVDTTIGHIVKLLTQGGYRGTDGNHPSFSGVRRGQVARELP